MPTGLIFLLEQTDAKQVEKEFKFMGLFFPAACNIM